jgi:hypothetical protein
MISRTHSGNLQPGERPSAATIVETLGGGSAIGLYALCCAERLSVVAEQLAGTPLIRRRVLVALELGWAVAVGHYRDAQAISTALADLDSYIGLDSNLGRFHCYLNDAVSAVAYALEAAQGNDSTAACNVVSRARDIYFRLTEEIWPTLNTSDQAASPIMCQEVSRQVRDAEVIASWKGNILPERLAALRHTAHAEGETLVELILNRQEDQKRSTSPDQQPLF